MAEWLDSAFYTFDNVILTGFNNLAVKTGGRLTPLFLFITFFGEKGLFFLALSLVLMLFKKTRFCGLTMLLAIGIGFLFTNVIIKNAVKRIRPYNADELYAKFHNFVGGRKESEYSFPSGHATVSITAMFALFLSLNKKWSWIGLVFAFLVGISRLYLMVHYPTDVIVGFIIGSLSATLSFISIRGIKKIIITHEDKKFCSCFLNFDIIESFKKKNK